MWKLFKYEWRKQISSKLIIGCILLALCAFYVLGTVLHKEGWAEIAMVFLVLAGMFAAIYVGVESLLVLNRDIRTKESYMLFMVPKSAYQILAAKILAAICQIFLTIVMFGAAFMVCFTAYMAANESLADMLNYLRQMVEEMFEVEIEWDIVLRGILTMFVAWINMIASGFLAIISVRTVLSRTKLAGVLAFAVYILLNWGTSALSGKAVELFADSGPVVLQESIALGVMAVITVICLILSGWMAEKKLSV